MFYFRDEMTWCEKKKKLLGPEVETRANIDQCASPAILEVAFMFVELGHITVFTNCCESGCHYE